MYSQIECPICGNETTVRFFREKYGPQENRCKFCGKYFGVTVVRVKKNNKCVLEADIYNN